MLFSYASSGLRAGHEAVQGFAPKSTDPQLQGQRPGDDALGPGLI